jgi:hypothetical protein
MVAQRGFAANRNGASDPYRGTTSVVPAIMAGINGFSPCALPPKIVAAHARFLSLRAEPGRLGWRACRKKAIWIAPPNPATKSLDTGMGLEVGC